jgi:hypothetical protein
MGLKDTGLNTVQCSHCGQHHYLRNPYYSGDAPSHFFPPADGLEPAPAFAMEVGTIVAGAAFMESFIPQIFAKLTGMSAYQAVLIFGAITSTSQKIGVLEVLRDLRDADEVKKDLTIVIEKFRKCGALRDYYAHAKFHYSNVGPRISIIPFFGDTKKRRESEIKTLDEVRRDADFMQRTKYMIRAYINEGVRPTR